MPPPLPRGCTCVIDLIHHGFGHNRQSVIPGAKCLSMQLRTSKATNWLHTLLLQKIHCAQWQYPYIQSKRPHQTPCFASLSATTTTNNFIKINHAYKVIVGLAYYNSVWLGYIHVYITEYQTGPTTCNWETTPSANHHWLWWLRSEDSSTKEFYSLPQPHLL